MTQPTPDSVRGPGSRSIDVSDPGIRDHDLTARMEPFDSFWEAPSEIEKGYRTFAQFYRYNYLPHVPADRDARILVISCGPGYFVKLLADEGYTDVIGIDSFPEKIDLARRKGLNCHVGQVFSFLYANERPFDCIIAEQELNHLTKDEVLAFLRVARENLADGGVLISHAINGTSPLTGSESLAGNFDHYFSFTEHSYTQALSYGGFQDIELLPLNLYVFWKNPLNYVALVVDRLMTLFFRVNFILVGKSARIFTKKIGAVCRKPTHTNPSP